MLLLFPSNRLGARCSRTLWRELAVADKAATTTPLCVSRLSGRSLPADAVWSPLALDIFGEGGSACPPFLCRRRTTRPGSQGSSTAGTQGSDFVQFDGDILLRQANAVPGAQLMDVNCRRSVQTCHRRGEGHAGPSGSGTSP